MNLYDRTVAASAEVATYRSVNLDEWRIQIDPVLEAAGEHLVGPDKVESITIEDDLVVIYTSYLMRGIGMTNDIAIPISVLKSDDPVHEANRYRIEKELSEARIRLDLTQQAQVKQAEKVAALEAELRDFEDSKK